MSKIAYPNLVNDIADAYRTATGTANGVKYGELPEKIASLNSAATSNGTLMHIQAYLEDAPSAEVKLDISSLTPGISGAVNQRAHAGDKLTVNCSGNFATTTKQWQRSTGTYPVGSMTSSVANDVLCILSGRTYKKTYEGEALVGYMCNTEGYCGPLLVSNVSENAVCFKYGSIKISAEGYFMYKGQIYWYSSSGYWMPNDCTDSSGLNRYKIPERTTLADAALMLLKASNGYSWADIDGATGDTLTVLQQMSRVRCALTGYGHITGTATSEEIEIIQEV